MNKEEFIAELKDGLSGLPQNDIDERVLFYTEMIDDRMEEGMSEEEAISGIGSVEEIVSQIISEVPLTKIVKKRITPDRALRTWEIVLIVLGSPFGAVIDRLCAERHSGSGCFLVPRRSSSRLCHAGCGILIRRPLGFWFFRMLGRFKGHFDSDQESYALD